MDNDNFRLFIDQVKEANDIGDVIGRNLKLNRNRKALCPFHEESEPSFSVCDKGQYFHCFGCGVGGDVIRFIELYKELPFMAALKFLANEVGMSIPTISSEISAQIVRDTSKNHILSISAAYYHRQLISVARDYLHGRGISNISITQFQIGWADGKLKNHLVDAHDFKIDDCIDAGVIKLDGQGVAREFRFSLAICDMCLT